MIHSVSEHPFLRRGPQGRNYVVIGRLTTDPDDEVWTWSKTAMRDIRAVFESEVCWSRDEWERDLCARGKLYERAVSIRCTMLPNGVDTPSLVAERILDLLVVDGVLRRPSQEEYEAIAQQPWPTRVVTRAKERLIVDDAARGEWFTPRALVMSEWAAGYEKHGRR